MSIMKSSLILLGAALAAALSTAPSTSLAASSSCSVAWKSGFCRTGSVPANPQHHFLHMNVHGPCELFTVVDVANYITVFQGSTGWSGLEKTLGQVYSSYVVYVYGGVWPVSGATIDN